MSRLLCRLTQIREQMEAIDVYHAGIEHALVGHDLLRIGDERVERLRRPGDAAALESRRIAVIRKLAGLAAEDPVERGPDAVYAALDRMAGDAFAEPLLAAREIDDNDLGYAGELGKLLGKQLGKAIGQVVEVVSR